MSIVADIERIGLQNLILYVKHVAKKNMDLNNRERCMVCFGDPEDGFELIKHHISYFPEFVCFVHFKCHEAIHHRVETNQDMSIIKNDILVQYEDGDSRRFYSEMKE